MQNKLSSEAKVKPGSNQKFKSRNAQLQQLQDEIDRLALLVNEAKKQSDRIQAAADALGDSFLVDLDGAVASPTNGDKRNRFRKSEN